MGNGRLVGNSDGGLFRPQDLSPIPNLRKARQGKPWRAVGVSRLIAMKKPGRQWEGHPGQLGGAAREGGTRQHTLEMLLTTFDAKRAAVVTLTLVLTAVCSLFL